MGKTFLVSKLEYGFYIEIYENYLVNHWVATLGQHEEHLIYKMLGEWLQGGPNNVKGLEKFALPLVEELLKQAKEEAEQKAEESVKTRAKEKKQQ